MIITIDWLDYLIIKAIPLIILILITLFIVWVFKQTLRGKD